MNRQNTFLADLAAVRLINALTRYTKGSNLKFVMIFGCKTQNWTFTDNLILKQAMLEKSEMVFGCPTVKQSFVERSLPQK